MGKYFGTDGIRGIVNESLDAMLAFKVGCAAATLLTENGAAGGRKPLILIGKDTRISSDMLEAALTAGICSAGVDVMPLGVLPTPAVAYLTVREKADLGIVISASHNPFEHNGIKIFGGEGFKLPDALEERIERIIDGEETCDHKTGGKIGRVLPDGGRLAQTYIDYLASAAECDVSGLRVAVDCANGAASVTARRLFERLGVDCAVLCDTPDGVNINDGCGSTHIERLAAFVREGGFDLGFAFDGDADRCLVVDETGAVVDGDRMMSVLGLAMKKSGRLKNDTIVATVMSNMGFHAFAREHGIALECAAVGDRNVLERMLRCGAVLGGEQSGHIIFLDSATTGDGQLAAVKFLSVAAASGLPVSRLTATFEKYPQVMVNVPVRGGNAAKEAIMQSPKLKEAVREQEKALGETGRVLVRPSGTEALIRVMAEAKSEGEAKKVVETIANLIKVLEN
jgi:phosphoglucosamine mutase